MGDRLDGQLADALQAEHLLDDDDAAEQRADVDAGWETTGVMAARIACR